MRDPQRVKILYPFKESLEYFLGDLLNPGHPLQKLHEVKPVEELLHNVQMLEVFEDVQYCADVLRVASLQQGELVHLILHVLEGEPPLVEDLDRHIVRLLGDTLGHLRMRLFLCALVDLPEGAFTQNLVWGVDVEVFYISAVISLR